MADVAQVTEYIDTTIFDSDKYDNLTDPKKTKIVNNAEAVLKRELSHHFKDAVPTEPLALQALHMLELDDSYKRAELGATAVQVSGMMISFKEMDRSVSPAILKQYPRRRVGRYRQNTADSFRAYERIDDEQLTKENLHATYEQ